MRFQLGNTLGILFVLFLRECDFVVDLPDSRTARFQHFACALDLRTQALDFLPRHAQVAVLSFVADGKFHATVVQLGQAQVRLRDLFTALLDSAVDNADTGIQLYDFIGNRRDLLFVFALFVLRRFVAVDISIRLVQLQRLRVFVVLARRFRLLAQRP